MINNLLTTRLFYIIFNIKMFVEYSFFFFFLYSRIDHCFIQDFSLCSDCVRGHDITFIVVGSELSNPSSNLRQGCLHFTKYSIPLFSL